jgi:hypothetical protein
VKSNVSDYLELTECIYIDASAKCIADVSDLRDLMTIRSRVKHEGLSFLTITLPQFARDFERSLATGKIDSTSFAGFERVKGGSIPVFLQGMISRVFDFETGRILDEFTIPNRHGSADIPTIVESVRQICLTFKKLEIECTPKRVRSAVESFIAIEQDLESFSVSEEDYAKFIGVSSMLWNNLVGDISLSECVPKHGPGTTAEHLSGNRKYAWQYWHDRLEPYFPLICSGFPLGIPEDSEELQNVTIVPEELEQPVRVVAVPKTLKSPRIIAIEPCCMQYVQQGIWAVLEKRLRSYWLTAGHVNFRDQTVNQRLAIRGSIDGLLATIDLSDASDRVPRNLALEMFRFNPDLRDAIDACRSTRAQLPGGITIDPLRKFASMGSALCFPVEAMYFYTVCVVALLEGHNLPVTPRNVYLVSRDVHVYGDDLIVPTAYAVIVLEHLQKYNCKVNVNKTFFSGSFRESCGIDAFWGYEVTPTYITKVCPENKHQASELISWVKSANLLYKRGYWHSAQHIFDKMERIVGPLPYVAETSEALGRFSYLGYESIERWNRDLQRFEIKGLVPRPVYRIDELKGYGALMKSFHRLENMPINLGSFPDGQSRLSIKTGGSSLSDSLIRFVLRGATALSHRWVSPH